MADLITDTFRKYQEDGSSRAKGTAITITKGRSKTDYSSERGWHPDQAVNQEYIAAGAAKDHERPLCFAIASDGTPCKRPVKAVGRTVCRKHRVGRKGMTPTPIAKRLWAKVDIGNPDECWEWQGATAQHGHGRIGIGSMINETRGQTQAHRIAWESKVGPIPDGLLVLHHCDNPPCCNPNHLFLGTQKDNVHDMINKRRHWTPWREKGENHPSAKLTEKQVLEIRQRGDAGESGLALAREYDIGPTQVHRIIHRESWTHI